MDPVRWKTESERTKERSYCCSLGILTNQNVCQVINKKDMIESLINSLTRIFQSSFFSDGLEMISVPGLISII